MHAEPLIDECRGRPLQVNTNAQPGGDFVATLNTGGVISMARSMAEPRGRRVVAAAIESLTADGPVSSVIRMEHRHGRGTR